jgi:DNA-binding NtrC family response regulator
MNNVADNQEHKILIIDDDSSYREVLKIRLEKEDFRVIEANSGSEALEILNNKENKPSLIMLDLVMPMMNGIDTLFKLKLHPVGKNIKIIMMTNKVNIREEIGQQYDKIIKKFGALEFISKSSDLNQIINKIKNYLNQ